MRNFHRCIPCGKHARIIINNIREMIRTSNFTKVFTIHRHRHYRNKLENLPNCYISKSLIIVLKFCSYIRSAHTQLRLLFILRIFTFNDNNNKKNYILSTVDLFAQTICYS